MTRADADQLAVWVDTLTPFQLLSLWRWLTRRTMSRLTQYYQERGRTIHA